MTAYRKRDLADAIGRALASMPVVVVTGMRQVGKSTLLLKDPAFAGRRYITMDDFSALEAARRDPEGLLSGNESVTIDEAQRCPELLPVIKRVIDRNRQPGRFILSGSANLSLLRTVTESLAGRARYMVLNPFNRREIRQQKNKKPFLASFLQSETNHPPASVTNPISAEEVLRGGMPSVCLDKTVDPTVWFKGFEQTYMERDLRQLSNVVDLIVFHQLMQLAALRSGRILNTSELGRDAKLNAMATTRYLNLAKVSFLVRAVPPYLKNRSSRLIKSSKAYFTDSGFACHLSGIAEAGALRGDVIWGQVLETYVAQNLSSIIEAHLPSAGMYYWSVQGRHEVDFIIESGRALLAIEIKGASRFNDGDIAGLKAFLRFSPPGTKALLAYNGRESLRIDKQIWAIPLSLLLS
jgi:predicted AAA+ superfamily ATPase